MGFEALFRYGLKAVPGHLWSPSHGPSSRTLSYFTRYKYYLLNQIAWFRRTRLPLQAWRIPSGP